jgi:chemotaxis protein methyltransferase WspC
MKSFVEVALPDVFKLLARRIGLNPDSVGLPLIQAAVNDHMDELGLDDATAYVERLHGSGEFDELVERVVVPETWFFRDLEPYRFLQHFVRERWRPRHPGERLRVLSVPCSTGEESYSITITLLGLGWSPERFRVDGVDISRVGIQKARTGSFGANSFREKTPIVSRPLDSFFRQHGEKRVVCDEARAAARFTRANLADLEFLPDVTPYDVIYCRNLLIYLVPEARERALAHFNRLLQPGGFVYLGHAESGVASAARLEVEDDRFLFAFRFGSPVDPSSPTGLLTPATMSRSGEFFKLPFQPLVTDISSPTATPRDHSPPPVAAPVDDDSPRRAVPCVPPTAPIVEPRQPSATPKPAPSPRRHAARSAAAPVNSPPTESPVHRQRPSDPGPRGRERRTPRRGRSALSATPGRNRSARRSVLFAGHDSSGAR